MGLRAPPALGSLTPPTNPDPNAVIDAVNWNVADIGMTIDDAVDDIEMDFAKMFDPAHEEANMYTEGNGWPGTVHPASSTEGDVEFL